MRLLLVEDDLSIQRFVERALVEAGYQVDATADAKSAEALALERVHDAFIIDLGLPDMDGLDLIARCRAQGNAAPVLILSARRSPITAGMPETSPTEESAVTFLLFCASYT